MSLEKDTLNEMFRYHNGKLYNKYTRNNNAREGEEVGYKHTNGYIITQINGKVYRLHRIIYIMFNGHIPQRTEIDHINRDRSDNRIENLRLVTRQQNTFNTAAKGCSFHKRSKKWIASIRLDGKLHHLGSFTTEEEAHKAYLEAKKKLHKIKYNDEE